MNEDLKKTENTENTENQNENKSSGQNSEPTRKQGFFGMSGTLIFTACIAIFVILYAVVNISSVSSVMSNVMGVLSPIIIGAGMAYLLNPVMKFLERKVFKRIRPKKLLRAISLITTYLLALIAVVAVVFLVIPQLVESVVTLISSFDEYIDHTIDLINGLIVSYLNEHAEITIDREQLFSFVTELFTTSGNLLQSIGEYAVKYGTGLVVGVKNFVFALFISVYILVSKESLIAQVNKLTSAFLRAESKNRLYKYAKLCNKTFGGFLIGKIIDSLIIGVITLVTLFLFDMPFYLLVSAIVCVTNVIPIFGPFIGAIPSFFIIFIVDPGKALIFLVIILVIQQLDGNVIGPKILGNSTGLSSLGVMVSILIMGEWMGIIGMILGVPIFAVILAIINETAEHRLRKKNMPVNTAEYYPLDSLIDPKHSHETLTHKLFTFAGHLFGRMFTAAFRRGNKTKKAEGSENTENSEKQGKEEENE